MNKYGYRKWIISGIVVGVCLIYIIRLFDFQVIDDYYKIKADNNSQRIETQYPARGLIYDRNDKLLVDNQAAYDLMMLPKQVKAFDTTELLNILGISKEFLERNIARCKQHSWQKPSILVSQITGEKYAVLQEKLYRYPGFYVQTRTLRKYNVRHSGGVFGYISEVSASDIEKDPYYAMGDYIGTTGLERTFEHTLRGRKGKKILLVDNFTRIKGSYADGAYDEEAIVGEDLHTTLDIELQEYAAMLMQNKKGGIVAIEPETGEILVKVTAPGYDPQLMVGLDRGRNYVMLNNDPYKPMFDRSTSAQYPPGSIFKPLQALVALEMGAATPATQFSCASGAVIGGNRRMGCHGHKSPLNLKESIEHSCNPYYAFLFRRLLEMSKYKDTRTAYTAWREYATAFGLSSRISPDFYEERPGNIPTAEEYDRLLKTSRWHPLNIISISIGQGELLITPMQMANMAAAIANRGYYITPHIVRPTNKILEERIEKHTIPIRRQHFETVIEGMERVIIAGTGRRAQVDSVRIAGKTGTVQNPPFEDHSVFIAFAPVDKPRIALVVYVENGGWGSSSAAPIAGLLIEKYLKKEIPEPRKQLEKAIIETNLLNPSRKK